MDISARSVLYSDFVLQITQIEFKHSTPRHESLVLSSMYLSHLTNNTRRRNLNLNHFVDKCQQGDQMVGADSTSALDSWWLCTSRSGFNLRRPSNIDRSRDFPGDKCKYVAPPL